MRAAIVMLGVIGVIGLGLGTADADTPDVTAAPAGAIDLGAPSRTSWEVSVRSPANDDGSHLAVRWQRTPAPLHGLGTVVVLRRVVGDAEAAATTRATKTRPSTILGPVLSPAFLHYGAPTLPAGAAPWDALKQPMPTGTRLGVWTVVGVVTGDPQAPIVDECGRGNACQYALLQATLGSVPDSYLLFFGDAVVSNARATESHWVRTDRLSYLALIAITGLALAVYSWLAKRKRGNLFVRRIAGVDAIEDAVGRSTEMGRPVLYVTGVEETQDIQTIASLLILGHVAKITAEYDTELKVANAYPLTMVVAEEVVRQGYARAGRPDAHRPENVMFITPEQFAFAAGVNGMILRDRPATNIYFGRFYAESLMLAETGHQTGAVQIAGTCELTQMPFFIAACDYTLLGEELYATSAYLSREPSQLAQLKAGDVMKVVIAALVVSGVAWSTLAACNVYPFTRVDLMGWMFR